MGPQDELKEAPVPSLDVVSSQLQAARLSQAIWNAYEWLEEPKVKVQRLGKNHGSSLRRRIMRVGNS